MRLLSLNETKQLKNKEQEKKIVEAARLSQKAEDARLTMLSWEARCAEQKRLMDEEMQEFDKEYAQKRRALKAELARAEAEVMKPMQALQEERTALEKLGEKLRLASTEQAELEERLKELQSILAIKDIGLRKRERAVSELEKSTASAHEEAVKLCDESAHTLFALNSEREKFLSWKEETEKALLEREQIAADKAAAANVLNEELRKRQKELDAQERDIRAQRRTLAAARKELFGK